MFFVCLRLFQKLCFRCLSLITIADYQAFSQILIYSSFQRWADVAIKTLCDPVGETGINLFQIFQLIYELPVTEKKLFCLGDTLYLKQKCRQIEHVPA